MLRILPLLLACLFLPGAVRSQSASPATPWLVVEISNAAPFPGEPILYTARMHVESVSQVEYALQLPSFEGFIHQPGRFLTFTEVLGGRTYTVFERRELLIAVTDEPRTITPAGIVAAGTNHATPIVTSEEIPVRIRGFPAQIEEPPAIVGQYEFTLFDDTLAFAVGQPALVSLSVTGIGNHFLLSAPQPVSDMNWLVTPRDAMRIQDDSAFGVIDYSYQYVPLTPGQLQTPVFRFDYFDTGTAEIRSVALGGNPVEVYGTELQPARSLEPQPDPPPGANQDLAGTSYRPMQPTTTTNQSRVPWFLWLMAPVLITFSWFIHRFREVPPLGGSRSRPVSRLGQATTTRLRHIDLVEPKRALEICAEEMRQLEYALNSADTGKTGERRCRDCRRRLLELIAELSAMQYAPVDRQVVGAMIRRAIAVTEEIRDACGI
jgi:hypothetical protein